MGKLVKIEELETEELSGIEPSRAAQIKAVFQPMVAMLEDFEEQYQVVIKSAEKEVTEELTQYARRLRLDIAKIRIQAEHARKAEKEIHVRAGKAIDGVNNVLKWAVSDRERKLKEIEDYFETQKQKRIELLQAQRVEQITPYIDDADERDLGTMDEDVWEAYFTAKKQAYEDRVAAEHKAAEERAEAERKKQRTNQRRLQALPYRDFYNEADVDFGEMSGKEFSLFLDSLMAKKQEYVLEQEKIKEENERLRKEREAVEKKAKAEREKREAEIKAERERIEKERQKREAEIMAERKKQEAELEAERAKLRAIEAEKKKKELAEKRRIQRAAKADEAVRLRGWIRKFELPELPGEPTELSETIKTRHSQFVKWALSEVKTLNE